MLEGPLPLTLRAVWGNEWEGLLARHRVAPRALSPPPALCLLFRCPDFRTSNLPLSQSGLLLLGGSPRAEPRVRLLTCGAPQGRVGLVRKAGRRGAWLAAAGSFPGRGPRQRPGRTQSLFPAKQPSTAHNNSLGLTPPGEMSHAWTCRQAADQARPGQNSAQAEGCQSASAAPPGGSLAMGGGSLVAGWGGNWRPVPSRGLQADPQCLRVEAEPSRGAGPVLGLSAAPPHLPLSPLAQKLRPPAPAQSSLHGAQLARGAWPPAPLSLPAQPATQVPNVLPCPAPARGAAQLSLALARGAAKQDALRCVCLGRGSGPAN